MDQNNKYDINFINKTITEIMRCTQCLHFNPNAKTCKSCNGLVCVNCIQKQSEFKINSCPNCNNPIEFMFNCIC